jgi:hypothetical protein
MARKVWGQMLREGLGIAWSAPLLVDRIRLRF